MNVYFYSTYLTYLLLIIPLLSQENARAPLPTLTESEILHFQMLVEGNNRFGFDLYQHLKLESGNLYFSPYSIVTGLGLAAIGAKGETAVQFQRAFHYSPALLLFIGDLNESLEKPSGSKDGAQLLLANALWLDKSLSILPSFKQDVQRNFRETLEPIDFSTHLGQSIQKINQWVSQKTKGKINNMVGGQDIALNMHMILTTAADLKGQWDHPFDRHLTKRLPFQITPQRNLLADMMRNTSDYLISKGEQWDMLVVPCKQEGQGSQIAMAILLPKKGVALSELEKKFNWENWHQWKKQLQNEKVNLTIPRFRIERRLNLENFLKRMGLNVMFSPEADFSKITGKKEIYLNQVFHKASVSTNENGIGVMAGYAIKPQDSSLDAEKVSYEFIADRPFIFVIWDQKTESILFMGRLSTP